MFFTKFLTQRPLSLCHITCNISRALQHRTPAPKTKETYPTLNRKPKFDSYHYEESIRPYAEDVTSENQYEKLSNMILPLVDHSYEEQLKIKQEIIEQSFDQIGNAILWDKRIDGQVLKYVEFQQGHFCHVEPIIPSPITEQYRCKDDLSCGYGIDGERTIGFYINPLNNKKFPNTLCIPPTYLKSMKSKHLLAVKHFDQFLKQHPLSVCANTNVLKKDQYWRTMTLKSNEQDHLMMIVVVHPQTLSKNEIDQMKKDLMTYFINGPGRECEMNSIYFQICAHNRCTSEENPYELVHGNEFLYETYNERRFRISPESFLQVNKKAAEIVYRSTLEHAQLDENTILLDIGSGIGVHSILASSIAKKVYAIDPSNMCIADGKFNAELNACRDNIEWICGFAEANLHRILKKIGDLHGKDSHIVAIVNPSRYSLKNGIIESAENRFIILRKTMNIYQVIKITFLPKQIPPDARKLSVGTFYLTVFDSISNSMKNARIRAENDLVAGEIFSSLEPPETNKTTSILRSLPSIQRILYVLCKADKQIMHNFYELAAGERSKLKQTGGPFIPTDVYPVDLLPHTTHADIVVKCVRV